MVQGGLNRGIGCGLLLLGLCLGVNIAGCIDIFPPPDGNGNANGTGNGNDNSQASYDNTVDPTNRSARYVGANSCRQCHPEIATQHNIHGHAHKLNAVQGEAPTFPAEGTQAGVPNPPEGLEWSDIAYVIGGYMRKARFIDQNGYVLTTGVEGVPTQWNLEFEANGNQPGFVAYEPEATVEKPYDFSCFVCHTTGAVAQDEDFPLFQEGRPGFKGTWQEAGVQCEECHGPGGNHFTTFGGQVQIDTTAVFVNTASERCGKCHARGTDPSIIESAGGYIKHRDQYRELLASGGHAAFACTTCHNAHVSTNYDRPHAIRNECIACHADQNMAIHQDKTFVRGDYVERLSCESCHMPYATKSGAAASASIIGDLARMGDEKTHIFRINPANEDFHDFFTTDLTAVRKDSEGKAAVTVDFVCLRCHNGIGNAFELTVQSAAAIARNVHAIQE